MATGIALAFFVVVVQSAVTLFGTPVQTNPVGIPTLTYNCAKLPSICENVNRFPGSQLQRLAQGGLGPLVNSPFVLHYDRQDSIAEPNRRMTARRDAVCPRNWKATHSCPELDQPLVVPEPFNRGGRTLSSGFTGRRAGTNQAAPGSYQILDPSGGDTGMAWTCDEWPPAISAEGGTQANSYCAPASSRCSGNTYTRSEQDFQSSAHGALRTHVFNTAADGIYEFHFTTVFDENDDSFATSVTFHDPSGTFGWFYGTSEAPQKRSLDEDPGTYHHNCPLHTCLRT